MNQNITQAGSGGASNLLDIVVSNWQRKKDIDYRWGRDNQIMERAHELRMERDRVGTMNDILSEGTKGAFKSHFDELRDNRVHGQKIGQIQEESNQERQTREHKDKQDLSLAQEITKGLYENSLDYSKGISPAVSINMQNIGPHLAGHPSLGVPAKDKKTNAGENPAADAGTPAGGKKPKTKVAPIAPKTGTAAKADSGFAQAELPFNNDQMELPFGKPRAKKKKITQADADFVVDPQGTAEVVGADGVTPAKIKKPSAKKVSTGGGVTEIRNPKLETGKRGA
jgi:hypothetical protein